MLNLTYSDILEEYEIDESIFVSCKISCTKFKDIDVYYMRIGIQPYENDNIGYITFEYIDFDLMIYNYKIISKKIDENMKVEE